jgi:hypothetical protein
MQRQNPAHLSSRDQARLPHLHQPNLHSRSPVQVKSFPWCAVLAILTKMELSLPQIP